MIGRETISASEWGERARALQREGWWLADLGGLDTAGLRSSGESRFEVVVQLLKHARKERLLIHVAAEGEPPAVPSVTAIWPTADFMEREAFDMFGIRFDGHPNLKRLLMPEEWEGHPLRKDYGVGKVPIQFKDQPFLQIDTPGQDPAAGPAGAPTDAIGEPTLDQETAAPRNAAFGVQGEP